jgi:hypothetical protein
MQSIRRRDYYIILIIKGEEQTTENLHHLAWEGGVVPMEWKKRDG